MERQYWIIRNGESLGPFTMDELRGMGITPDTKVWFVDLKDWTPAGELSLFDSLFAATPEQEPQAEDVQAEPAARLQPKKPKKRLPRKKQQRMLTIQSLKKSMRKRRKATIPRLFRHVSTVPLFMRNIMRLRLSKCRTLIWQAIARAWKKTGNWKRMMTQAYVRPQILYGLFLRWCFAVCRWVLWLLYMPAVCVTFTTAANILKLSRHPTVPPTGRSPLPLSGWCAIRFMPH